MNAPARLAVRLLARISEVVSRWQRGYSVPFGAEMIYTMGFRGVARAGKQLDESARRITQLFGDRDGQLLMAMAAMWNGCTFCSVGHVYAANLYHFREGGSLFPLDEREVTSLQRRRDGEVIEDLRLRFATELPRTWALLLREFDLKSGRAAGSTPDDDGLRLALAAWDWLNECTITTDQADVPPLCILAKDKALIQRYRAARESSRQDRASISSQ
jgi:hypothetical protein